MVVTELPLSRLVPNDYNPRRSLHSETVSRLVESIEIFGFDGSLTVRPVGFAAGDDPDDYPVEDRDQHFEVVSGSQRFAALERLEYADPIPVTTRYIDRETAKLHAIVENRIRSDPTPMEDAHAFAGFVSVTLDADPDGLETRPDERPQGDTIYRATFSDYIDYIKAGRAASEAAWHSPTADSASVDQAAETIPGVSARTIQNKLALLWLPDRLHADIDNGALAESHGVILSRLRKLGDVEAMHQAMVDLAAEDLDREALREEVDRVLASDGGDGPDAGGSNVAAGRLREAAASHRDLSEALIEASQNTEVAALGALQGPAAVTSRAAEAAFLTDRGDGDRELIDIGDLDLDALPDVTGALSRPPDEPIVVHARRLIEATEAIGAAIGTEREDALADQHRRLDAIQQRRQQTADEVRENSLDRCPHCGEPTFAPRIDDRAEDIAESAEGVADDLHAVRRAQSQLGGVRSELRDALAAFEDDCARLQTVVPDAGVEVADSDEYETDLKPDRVETLLANAAALSREDGDE
jgi:hypothetical protein